MRNSNQFYSLNNFARVFENYIETLFNDSISSNVLKEGITLPDVLAVYLRQLHNPDKFWPANQEEADKYYAEWYKLAEYWESYGWKIEPYTDSRADCHYILKIKQ